MERDEGIDVIECKDWEDLKIEYEYVVEVSVRRPRLGAHQVCTYNVKRKHKDPRVRGSRKQQQQQQAHTGSAFIMIRVFI